MIKALNYSVSDIPEYMVTKAISLSFFDQSLLCICYFKDDETETEINNAVGVAFAKAGKTSVLAWMYVRPESRGQGIGTALEEYTEIYLRRKGSDRCIISVAGSNYQLVGINGFIERMGYEIVPIDIHRIFWSIPTMKMKLSADWIKETRAKRPASISLTEYRGRYGHGACEAFINKFVNEIGNINIDNLMPAYSRIISAEDKVAAAMLVTVENHSYMLSKLYMDGRAESMRLDLLCTLFVDVINGIEVLYDFDADARIVEASKYAIMDIRYDDRYEALVSQFGAPFGTLHIWEYVKELV